MSTEKYRKKLRELQRRQEKVLRELLEVRPILKGTVNKIYTRCGNPTVGVLPVQEDMPISEFPGIRIAKRLPEKFQRISYPVFAN